MRRIVWMSALGLALVAGLVWWVVPHPGTPPVITHPRPIERGPIAKGPNRGPVALLTFDDCPYEPWSGAHDSPTPAPTTPSAAWTRFQRTIATAQHLGVALVLAPTGECENRYRAVLGLDLARYARSHGMWVIAHSYDHERFPKLTMAQLRFQIENSVPSYWLRPPYGAYDPKTGELMRSMGRRPWTWTVSSRDFTGLPPVTIVRTIVSQCTDGQTCLLHMQWSAFNPAVLTQMVVGMKASGTLECAIQTRPGGAVVRTPVWWHALSCDPTPSRRRRHLSPGAAHHHVAASLRE